MRLGGKTRLRTPSGKPIEPHSRHRDRLLRHADKMLEKGDRLQASEKIWGAVAHGIKHIARRRKWPNHAHEDLQDIARYLSEKEKTSHLYTLFKAVEHYHRNFYADTRRIPDIRTGKREADELVELLKRIDETMPLNLAPPHGRDYQDYQKRHRRAA